MPNVRDITSDNVTEPRFTVLNWNKSGTGKTCLLGTFDDPMYVFDFDGRIQVLATTGKNIDYDYYSSADPNSYTRASAKLEELLKLRPFPYKTVGWDTLDSFASAVMEYTMPYAKSFYKIHRPGDGTVEVPVMQDYQVAGRYIVKTVRRLLLLPCNIVMNVHESSDKDEITLRTFFDIDCPGKGPRTTIPGLFNEVWRSEVDVQAKAGRLETVYRVRTRPDNLYSARTCYPNALDVLEVPDFQVIKAKIMRHLREVAAKNSTKQ